MSTQRKRWEASDLRLLKSEFGNGTRLKVIARMLGRTETAINKALTRNGIRVSNTKHRKTYLYKYCNSKERIYIVNLNTVIDYLKSKRYRITRLVQYSKTLTYRVNNVAVSNTKLLIIANKHRLEEGLPIFCLKKAR